MNGEVVIDDASVRARARALAAAFAGFNPAVVVAAVSHGWSLTDAQCRVIVETLGDDFDESLAVLSRGVSRSGSGRLSVGGSP